MTDFLPERIKIACLDQRGIVAILNWSRAPMNSCIDLPIHEEIPSDVKVVGIFWNELRRSLCVMLEHPSFPIVAQGCEPPFIVETAREAFRRSDWPESKVSAVMEYVEKKVGEYGAKMQAVQDPDGVGREEYRSLLELEESMVNVKYGLEWAVGRRGDWPRVKCAE